MKQYLYEFQDLAAYNAAKATLEKPSASYLISERAMRYDPWVPTAVVGDYLFSDKSFSSDLVQGKTPIAICVAPASHFQNAKARWMSLVNMSATDPEHGTISTGNDSSTNPGAGFCWGASGNISGLTANDQLPTLTCENVNQPGTTLSQSTKSAGYVPSDYLNSDTCETPVSYPLDSRYNYYGDDNDMSESKWGGAVPSPFNQDGTLNSWARLNALQYENGKSMTASILAGATKYSTGEITRSDSEEGSYPAAIACSRFVTSGTAAGDWYLPSAAELMYVIVHLDLINSKLGANSLSSAAVQVGNKATADTYGLGLWSSSVSSSVLAWYANTYYCYLCNSDRGSDDDDSRVRAFLEL